MVPKIVETGIVPPRLARIGGAGLSDLPAVWDRRTQRESFRPSKLSTVDISHRCSFVVNRNFGQRDRLAWPKELAKEKRQT